MNRSTSQAAKILNLHVSRVKKLCQSGRLGYTVPRVGRSWIITDDEIAKFRETGPLPAGRPKNPPANNSAAESNSAAEL